MNHGTIAEERKMRELLSDKSVIFFDVGYTIDYPASGDWVFTNRFYLANTGHEDYDIEGIKVLDITRWLLNLQK